MTDYATDSESLFADYLAARGLSFDYEPNRDEPGRNPDFWVHATSGDVVCEVTEMDWFRRLPVVEEAGADSTSSSTGRVSTHRSS